MVATGEANNREHAGNRIEYAHSEMQCKEGVFLVLVCARMSYEQVWTTGLVNCETFSAILSASLGHLRLANEHAMYLPPPSLIDPMASSRQASEKREKKARAKEAIDHWAGSSQ